jgi:GT2 family glycosyltransferase
MNGNVVLVPKSVMDKIGILDPVFHHDLGDVDYGLRAIKAGIKVFSTRKAIALGYSNHFCRVRKWNTSLINRFKRLYSPLGSPPKTNFYFRKKHFGIINAYVYWIYLHMINILSDKMATIIWGDLYHDKL